MEHLSPTVNTVKAKLAIALITATFFISFSAFSQNRPFSIVYSENIRGGSALFGNTLMNAVTSNGAVDLTAMNGNSANGSSSYTNGGATNMQFVDIDGNNGDGAGTRNSSSSDLILPSGTNKIKMARLYWGGRALSSDFDMTKASNRTIKIRKGTTGVYLEFAASQIDIKTDSLTIPGSKIYFYQAYVDITSLIDENGAGTYTVGNGAFSTGLGGDFGNFGAWSIVTVYENQALSYNSIRVYDGYQEIYNGGNTTTRTITLSGLNAPSGAMSLTDAKLGIMGWEGDSRYTADYLKINNNFFSNALNPATNSWNSTITDDGVHVTTKNPNYTDQMGIDIDQFNVGLGYGIMPNATDVTLDFGTGADQYWCGVVTFVIKMKDPVVNLTKTVTDANHNQTAEAGEVLTYKLRAQNVGTGNANTVVLTDAIPSTMTFINNSLKVNYAAGVSAGVKTDASGDDIADYNATTKTVTFRLGNGADANKGGFLAAQDSVEVEFQVTVNTPANGFIPPIINVARINSKTDANENLVDDATAVINPQGGPLPVTLIAFSANILQVNKVKIDWSTSMEYNSKSYEIERSLDGVLFNKVATLTAGGNSSVKLSYTATDDVTAVTSSIVYYRLKQIDIDGKASISKVVSVRLKKAISNFTVSPNPFQNNVNINIEWNKNETTIVKVYNIDGKEIVSKSVNMTKGLNYFSIEELERVQPGNYVIQFNTSEGKLFKQVVKQK